MDFITMNEQAQSFIIISVDAAVAEATSKWRDELKDIDGQAIQLLKQHTQEAVSFNFSNLRSELEDSVRKIVDSEKEKLLMEMRKMMREFQEEVEGRLLSMENGFQELKSLKHQVKEGEPETIIESSDDVDSVEEESNSKTTLSLDLIEDKLFGKTFGKKKKESESEDDEDLETTKKGRGRPKNSRNKTMSKKALEMEAKRLEEENKQMKKKLEREGKIKKNVKKK